MPRILHKQQIEIKNCSHYEKYEWCHTPQLKVHHPSIIIWKWGIHYVSLSTIFNLLHSNTNWDLIKKHLYNQGSHYEKYRWFPLHMQGRKPSRATTKSTLFAVSKDEWNTNEDTGWCMKNALYVLRYAYQMYILDWSDVENWKNQARSVSCYRVMLVWRHQLGSQSVTKNSVK